MPGKRGVPMTIRAPSPAKHPYYMVLRKSPEFNRKRGRIRKRGRAVPQGWIDRPDPADPRSAIEDGGMTIRGVIGIVRKGAQRRESAAASHAPSGASPPWGPSLAALARTARLRP